MSIDKAEKEIQALLEKYNLKIGYGMNFPTYKKLPTEAQLALAVLEKHGMKIVFTLESK